MSQPQKIVPFKGVDVDTDELYLSGDMATFLKNVSYDNKSNPKSDGQEGANAGVFTPLRSNTKYCNLVLPKGKNFCIGYYESREMVEGYVFVWNSNNKHLIYRINGRSGDCQKVYENKCLNFILEPRHFISHGRCVLQTTAYVNKFTGQEEIRKYLIFTDDKNPQRFISVEDSIATDSFNPVTFPIFDTIDNFCKECNIVNLGLATPLRCVNVTSIPRDLSNPDEKNKPNLINYKSWQFRIKYIDVWGRESEHGPISDMYIGAIGSSCLTESNGLPRCLRLKFAVGCPWISKIQIEFRNCSGNVRGLSIQSDWFLYDTINKYDECEDKQWYDLTISNPYQVEYDRQIALGLTPADAAKKASEFLRYFAADNTFEYTFCGNKECTSIDFQETNRGFNPLPITSGSVFSTGKSIGLARNRKGQEPIDCDELKKIKYKVTPPQKLDTCQNIKLRKIIVWAAFYNKFDGQSVFLRKDKDRAVFGNSDCAKNNPYTYQQVLPKDQEGIVGYLAGTKHFAVSKQYKHQISTNEDILVGLDYIVNTLVNTNDFVPLQKFEFDVLPGEYVFRLSGHRSKPTDEYQKTSTYLIGQTQRSNVGVVVKETNELIINVCDEDVEIKNEPLLIYDLTRLGKGCAVAEASNVVEGYLREDEIQKLPIKFPLLSV